MNKQEIKFCLVDLIRKAKKIISKQEIPDLIKGKGNKKNEQVRRQERYGC